MTRNILYFASLPKVDGGNVTYIDNGKGKIIGEDDTGNSSLHIDNVLYVEGLKHNLLSVNYVIMVVKLYLNQILVLFMMLKTTKSSLLLKKIKMFIQ